MRLLFFDRYMPSYRIRPKEAEATTRLIILAVDDLRPSTAGVALMPSIDSGAITHTQGIHPSLREFACTPNESRPVAKTVFLRQDLTKSGA